MQIIFIRHGSTPGNEKKRYIGSTDEGLSSLGIKEVTYLSTVLPKVDKVYSSPLKRAFETAKIIYPKYELNIVDDFRETNFGHFENRSAEELKNDREYIEWLDSYCTLPIPGGENVKEFKQRTVTAFERLVSTQATGSLHKRIAIVAHGGTIMSILEAYAYPQKDFYDYHIGNAEYVFTELKNSKLLITGGALCK